jgi:membrane glycosyltransferase
MTIFLPRLDLRNAISLRHVNRYLINREPALTGAFAAESRYSASAKEHLVWRRLSVLALCAASWAGLGALAAHALGGRLLSLETLALVCFLAALPWTLLNVWNAIIGFIILRFARDPAAFTNPALARTPASAPITTRTAICLAIRHEAVEPVFKRLAELVENLQATDEASAFTIYILSDSDNPKIVSAEQEAVKKLQHRLACQDFLLYRRRPINAGFKAGNLHDFARNEGQHYDFMLVLDADSTMSTAAMLRLVRVMQTNPQLGILQTLVTGRPSENAFTRVFQFGMRNGMRTHATGLAWWQGPSGPYWGHNAILRIAPFAAHCALSEIRGSGPLAGPILSHDQIEAALMRKAGFEIRLIADACGSWEENPPDLLNFIKRDLRWCQGNLQYARLIGRLALMPMGVFQLVNAMMMYLSSVFWVALLLVGLAIAAEGDVNRARTCFALYLLMFGFWFLPRLLGVLELLLDTKQRQRYGGARRLGLSTVADAVFTLLLGTVMAVTQTLFICALFCGRRVTWEAQHRESGGVRTIDAARNLWPQTAFGVVIAATLIVWAPGALPVASPTLLSCLAAIPFATLTASARLGRFMQRRRLCAAPEERE